MVLIVFVHDCGPACWYKGSQVVVETPNPDQSSFVMPLVRCIATNEDLKPIIINGRSV